MTYEWCAPGDRQEDVWLLRFDDAERGDMLFRGMAAEAEARARWEEMCGPSGSYNGYLFRLARPDGVGIIVRMVRGGKDPHDWAIPCTLEEWVSLTGEDGPASVDYSDVDPDIFDYLIQRQDVRGVWPDHQLDSDYIVECS